MIYKKSHQVYEGILAQEEAELNEENDQLDRELTNWVGERSL